MTVLNESNGYRLIEELEDGDLVYLVEMIDSAGEILNSTFFGSDKHLADKYYARNMNNGLWDVSCDMF